MALPEAPTYGKEARCGFAVESVSGTSVTDATGVVQLTGLDSVSIDRGIRQYEHMTGDSKDPLLSESIMDVSGSKAIITISGKLNRHLLPYLLNAHFQYVSSDVYSYFDDHPTTPYSLTFIKNDPTSGRDEVYSGCVIASLSISAERGDDDLVMFEAVLHSKDAGSISQTLSGTADPANWRVSGSKADNYGKFHLTDMTYTIDVGGGDVAVVLNSFNMQFAYDEIEQLDPSGNGTYNEVGFTGRENCTFECTVLPSTNTEIAKSRMRNGGSFKLTTAGYMKSWVTGQITAFEPDVDGLTKINITAQAKALDKNSNLAEFDLS